MILLPKPIKANYQVRYQIEIIAWNQYWDQTHNQIRSQIQSHVQHQVRPHEKVQACRFQTRIDISKL